MPAVCASVMGCCGGRSRQSPGFTLLELLLVMAIIGLMTAAMAPRISRAWRGLELHGSCQEVVATAQFAAHYSIRNRIPTKLVYEEGGRRYWLEVAEKENAGDAPRKLDIRPIGQGRELPVGMKLEHAGSHSEEAETSRREVLFGPDGTGVAALVKATNRHGRSRWIEFGGLLGRIEVHRTQPNV